MTAPCYYGFMSERAALLEESRRLSALLIQVAEQAKADFADAVAPFGLPVHLARALLNLEAAAPMRDLAEHLACDRSYVTGLADKLQERGLVSRTPGEDRRVKLLELTTEGVALRDRMVDAIAEHSTVLSRLSEAERRTLEPLLKRLVVDAHPATASC